MKKIQDQKNFLQKKLNKMNHKVKKTKKIKNDRTEPWNKNKFLLYKKGSEQKKSELVNRGYLMPSSKGRTWGMRGARSGLIKSRNTWNSGRVFQSSRSNFKKPRSKQLTSANRSDSKGKNRLSFKKKSQQRDFKVTKLRKESPNVVDSVKRHEFVFVPPKIVANEERNKMREKEKMSKLFTKERRKQAKSDFMDRTMFNLQKQKINKEKLKEKFYNYNFQPEINKKRIDIYSGNPHKNVYSKTFEKKREIRESNLGILENQNRGLTNSRRQRNEGQHPREYKGPAEALGEDRAETLK